MSIRYEWATANDTAPSYLPPLHYADGEAATIEDQRAIAAGYVMDQMSETGALVLSHGEATVIEGSPAELRALLLRALATLPAEASDSDPAVVTVSADDLGAEAVQVRRIDTSSAHVVVLDRLWLDPHGTVVESNPADLVLGPDQAAALATAVFAANAGPGE